MRGELSVLPDPAAAAAERLAAAVARGGHIALAGGSTPRAAYQRVAGLDLDWSRSTLWFGDDRCVPPGDRRSNYRMVKEALLDPLGKGAPEVHRIRGELGPQEAADAYERALREAFAGELPVLDLALMGLGPDGHTASLFPSQPALDERERFAVAVAEAGMEPYVPRVTLTLPVINAAREVLFLIKGEDKADAVARAFADPPGPQTPASLVEPASGALGLLCDPTAATRLDQARA